MMQQNLPLKLFMIYKKLQSSFCILFLCFVTINASAQLGMQLNLGLMNYGGDLQSKNYTFNEANFTGGAALIYTINSIVLRAGFNYGGVQASDAETQAFAKRNLSFKTNISEGSFCIEYDYNPHQEKKIMPYIFAGVGVFHYNPYAIYDSQKVYLQPLGTEGQGLAIYPDRKFYKLTDFEVPLGIGVKYKLSSSFIIGVEFNSRLLFTDYLDDVSNVYPDESELYKARGQLAIDLSFRGNEINSNATFPSAGAPRGNAGQKDNYYSSIVTLTYIFSNSLFGSPGNRKSLKALNCPKKVM